VHQNPAARLQMTRYKLGSPREGNQARRFRIIVGGTRVWQRHPGYVHTGFCELRSGWFMLREVEHRVKTG
jgi:hypothetical protein